MFCQKCGNKITESAIFCPKCGVKLIIDDVVQQQPLITSVAAATQQDANLSGDAVIPREDKDLLKALIGKNSDYYLKHFERIDRGEKSFNWYAFFFAPFLLLYRKQFSYFIKLFLPVFLLPFALMLLTGYAIATLNFELIATIASAYYLLILPYGIVMSIICGRGFNKHYKTQLHIAIAGNQLKIADGNIIKNFKPSARVPILFVILYIALSFALSFVTSSMATNYLLKSYDEAATVETAPNQASTQIPTKNNESSVNVAQTDMRKVSSGEILHKGKTITNWLGKRPKGLWNEFGAPLNTGKARGGDYRSYESITFFINVKSDEIIYIGGTNLELFTVNGVSLNKDRAGLISIFGNPQKEGQVIGGDNEGSYYMAYDYMGYSLVFYRSNPNGKIEWFEISNKKG